MDKLSIRVLLIDDDEDYYFITRKLLSDIEGINYHVTWVSNLNAASQAIVRENFDVFLVDYQMGQENGLEFVRQLMEDGVLTPFILMTGRGSRSTDLEAMNLGVADYLNKGELNPILLERTIRYAIDRARNLSQLREYAEDLEAKNRELDAYTHTIAHDLTNPLSLISGLVGLILLKEEKNLSPEIIDMLKSIEGQTLKMSDMVTQLLWLAKLRDASEYIIPMELTPIAETAVSRFLDRIQNQNVQDTVKAEMPIAMGQAIWVEEVIANLVSNALKYMGEDNPEPQIKIHAHKRDDFVICQVEDNGIGIAPQDQSRLFEMFGRIRNKQTRDIPGLGLGLSIVQRIISKLGGEVGVTSTLGVGSCFWFSLPSPRPRSLESQQGDYRLEVK